MEGKKFLYSQLHDDLREAILSGGLRRGDKLPVEAMLQEQYGVSAITVKKALSLLAQEGLIHRVPGRGSFVAEDFVPGSPEARPAPAGRAGTIGVVFEHVATPFGLDMFYAMDRAALERGLRLCPRFSYGEREREADEIRFLLSLGVGGLIIMPSHGPHYSTDILRLVVDGFPVILVDKNLDGVPVLSVRTDNEEAVGTLVRHLAARGRGHIAFVTVDEAGTTSLLERRRGFYGQMAACCLEAAEELVLPTFPFVSGGDHTSGSEAAADYFARMRGAVDAVVCAEFGLVPRVFAGLERCGLAVPQDVAVCCIDEDYDAPAGYTCTHARQNEEEIGRLAVSLMADWIGGKRPPVMEYKIPALFRQGRTT